MERIEDRKKLEHYIVAYGIHKLLKKDITPYMELFRFDRNDYVCQQESPMSYFYFFLKGKVGVYSCLANGKRLLLCFYDSFQVIGDIELVEGIAATTDMQVVDETYCIGIPLNTMRDLVMEDATFLRFICQSLGKKLNRCSNNSTINLLYPLENRLASYIQVTSIQSLQGYILFEGNLLEVAELLGTSYRHLLRTLEKFCDMGYITKLKKGYKVIEKEKIRELGVEVYL